MNVLDIGTGPGVVPLAIADFYSRLDDARATVWSLERSEEHIEAFTYLRNACVPPGGRVSVKPPVKTDIRTIDRVALPDTFDLLIFSNVLNELVDSTTDVRADIVTQLSERLAPDGSILIVEPADEENAIRMLYSYHHAPEKRALHVWPMFIPLGFDLHRSALLEF